MRYGLLIAVDINPIPEEMIKILGRFAKVFEQTYTRFLDLQKAEAQARESQIQLALERVRARTMAMQHSDELSEASFLLDSQVRALGIKTRGCAFNIYGENESTEWFSGELGTMPTYKTPRENFFLTYYEAGQRGETFLIDEYAGEECVALYDYLCSLPVTGEGLRQFKASGGSFPAQQIVHVTYFKYGYLLFITLEPVPEAHDIFKRFAKVFEQTYTRFLDLQKAEAQAREAKIEAALEKVRSRTMAMQKSEDLNKAASDMFKQIQVLGMQPWACGFNIFDKDEKAVTQYMSLADGGISPPFRTPLTEDPFFISIYEARQRKEDLLVMESSGKELEETYRYMFSLPGSKEIFGDLENSGFEMPKFQITHCAYFSQGYLVFITYEHVPESLDIFKRFAKVFDQTYTRFLDLQKAEAQARESQIQLALERVRARTMAMQRSDELGETSSLLFKQVIGLSGPGHTNYSCGFNIWETDNISAIAWMSKPDGGFQDPFRVPYTEDSFFKQIYEARKSGSDFFVMESGGEALAETYRYMFNLLERKKVFEEFEASGFPTPTFQITHCVFFPQGYLMFITYEPVPEMWDVFKRFAKVFEQTYTRFLDLQKAEAQAREAEIELGLERVRARAMAMQKSDELAELVDTVFKELTKLHFTLDRCILIIIDEDSRSAKYWMSNP
jgi:hypothetical protein